jgi:hypothetical protein
MHLDLLADLVYDINSSMWDMFGKLEWDPRRQAEFDYDTPALLDVKEGDEEEPPSSEYDD